MEGFYTVVKDTAAEQIIDKSRFIALVSMVTSVEDTQRHRQTVEDQYPNARHYVYAYRIHEGRLEKASDDGEPQGTGGRPVLDLLQHRQLWNIQIIVVRYFGGVLLGTGGLTRAYGGTARLALEETMITLLIPHYIYQLRVPYSMYEQIKYQIRQKNWDTSPEQFSEQVTFDIFIPEEEAGGFEQWLIEYTNKHVPYENVGTVLRTAKIV
ncbi:MAG: hypothetical protein APF84_18985 [Gracilibacter sp. BRH_c7a]|nr:MAG: hypothetical protein APF84_18985 [Gracilibacter sp. BRH_c7a]